MCILWQPCIIGLYISSITIGLGELGMDSRLAGVECEVNKERKKNDMVKVALIILVVVLISDILFEIKVTKLSYGVYETSKLPIGKKLKVLQISDFHDKKSYHDELLIKIQGLSPDIVVITGDFLDADTKDLKNAYSFIDKLKKINSNIYFVSGNHEWRNSNREKFIQGLKDRKVYVLNNGNNVVTINNIKINLCGIDDFNTKHGNLQQALEEIDRSNLTLLLSHVPNIAMRNKDLDVDLVLSGHTHGGQVRLPFIGALIAPGQGYFPKYTKGFYKINKNIVYIDSGAGTSSFPVRFLNRSQVSLITFEGR